VLDYVLGSYKPPTVKYFYAYSDIAPWSLFIHMYKFLDYEYIKFPILKRTTFFGDIYYTVLVFLFFDLKNLLIDKFFSYEYYISLIIFNIFSSLYITFSVDSIKDLLRFAPYKSFYDLGVESSYNPV
jgi:hypothetical protein